MPAKLTAQATGFPACQSMKPDTATKRTVAEALADAAKDDLTDVLILAYDADGNLCRYSSHMTRAEALFLLESSRPGVMQPDPI